MKIIWSVLLLSAFNKRNKVINERILIMITEKEHILLNGFNDCMKYHTCGNYISMSDVEGLESPTIEWYVNTDSLQMVARTEFGTYNHKYDYDFSFDDNLCAFVEGLQEFLMNEINAKKED